MTAGLQLFEDLDAVASDAQGALDREAQHSLFDRLDWFRLVDRFTPQGRVSVVRAREGEARAWLFLYVQGRNAEALGNWYSVRFGPVLAGTPAAAPLLGKLARGLRRAGVSRIFLEPMDEPHPLSRALRRHGWATSVGAINVSWRIDTRGMGFDEYWGSRPGRLRSGIDRRVRQGKVRTVIHDRFDEQAWQAYEAVYAASWKPLEGSPAFLRPLAEREGAAGTLRLGVARNEGQAVAAQAWLVENGVATIFKSAYRKDARRLAPGNILRRALFKRVLDVDRVELIDFGIGGHSYKADWMSYTVPLYALTAYDLLHPAGLAGLARSGMSKLVRRWRSR